MHQYSIIHIQGAKLFCVNLCLSIVLPKLRRADRRGQVRGVCCTHYAPPEMGGDRIINNGEQCLPQSRSQYISKSKWHVSLSLR